MNFNFQSLIPKNFNNHSRVWVYQSNRAFTKPETLQIERHLRNRIKGRKSQDRMLKFLARLFLEQFIIIIVDQSGRKGNGFSADNFIELIKEIEQDFQVALSDRQMLAFIIGDRIQVLPLTMLNDAIEKDLITPETLYFNNAILTKKELMNNWIVPVKESWLGVRILDIVQTEL